MDSKPPEVIEQQMEETRNSLTEKVAALENQVVGTVQTATQAVQDTVATVKSAVQETVSAVKENIQESVSVVKETVQESVAAVTDNVKETFDVRTQIERNPFLMVGGAAVAGFLTGLLIFRKDETSFPAPLGSPYPEGMQPPPPAYAPQGVYTAAPQAPAEPGFFDELLSMAGVEAKQLARETVNQASQAIRQHVMPSLMQWMTHTIENAFPPQGAASPARPWESPARTETASMARR